MSDCCAMRAPLLVPIRMKPKYENRDKTFSSTLYAEVVKNLETLKLSLINQTPVIQILDTPKYPLFNQRTPARYFLIIGFAVGFVLSFLYALYKYTSN